MKLHRLTVKDPHVALFNRIAPVYRLFYRYQASHFKRILPVALDSPDVPGQGRVLDIGCGSGALTAILSTKGFHAVGVDAAPRMVYYAKKNAVPGRLMYCVADGTSFLPFRDMSFDIVAAAYVLHGIIADKRRRLMREARRLSRGVVIFYDYYRRSLPADFVEWMEGGDYRAFVDSGREEMVEIFKRVNVVPSVGNMAWYICSP